MNDGTLSIVSGSTVLDLLSQARTDVLDVVRETYLLHHSGFTVNPPSQFLRFPRKPDSRIISLPAHLGGDDPRTGMKWISSFPGNLGSGLPRASALLILNDDDTGRPVAVLDAAAISAARTGASAALAASMLSSSTPRTVGVVGCGPIAAATIAYLHAAGMVPESIFCHDLHADAARQFALANSTDTTAARETSLAAALEADLVLFATSAPAPHLPPGLSFEPRQVVLGVSLRDLAPETLLRSNNVFDDVAACLKAGTSAHLALDLCGDRRFVTGTLAQVIRGETALDRNLPTIFSPFGLGVLDVAVGTFVWRRAKHRRLDIVIPEFFPTGETPVRTVAP